MAKSVILQPVQSRNYAIDIMETKVGSKEYVLSIRDRIVPSQYTDVKISALGVYKDLKSKLRGSRTDQFDKDCRDLISKKAGGIQEIAIPPATSEQTQKIAALTVKLYAGEVLVKESSCEHLWAETISKILAA